LAVFLTLWLALTILVPTSSAAAPFGFVSRTGTRLVLNGKPFRFTGLNVYNANSRGMCWYDLQGGSALDDALTAIGPGHEVVRAWFFQPLAIAGGLRDWSAFDHTLAVAQDHGMKVIPTLTDQYGECGDGGVNGFKPTEWYESGYTQVDPGNLVSYRNWVGEIVSRYKYDRRIAFWQLINEAEVTEVGQPCPPGNEPADILKAWTTDVSGLVKSLDQNHLVSLGTIGGGQCGAQGPQYQYVHDVATIDLCEYHDYGSPNVAMPGDEFNGLQVRINQCNVLNRPVFVGEAGIIPNQVGGTLAHRAAAFEAKIEAQFAAGIQGFLAWDWSSLGSTLDNFDIGPGDPALETLIGPKAFRSSFRR
jgi:endo-1,4-beta-mannosidase